MADRRKLVGFDPDHFAKVTAAADPPDALTAFRYAYQHNLWRSPDARSGPGSSAAQTEVVAAALPRLCQRYHVTSLLDVPCGSFNWMAMVDLRGITYTGGDIVPELVAEVDLRHGRHDRQFLVLNLTRSPLPTADLLFCRDCFVHLSFDDIVKSIGNIKRTDIKYLLTTTFTAETEFQDIVTGDWRPINLELPPFSFPTPLERVVERCTEHGGAFADKALGLWRVRDLPQFSVTTS